MLLIEVREGSFVEFRADDLHEIVVEIQVVQHCQTHAEHLAALEQVAYIRPGKIAAGGAVAALVNGTLVQLIFGVIEVAHALPREELTVPRVSAGHDAVE